MRAVAETLVGKMSRDETSSELTAVPVVLERGQKLPAPKGLSGWLLEGETALPVVAAEEGAADVVFVLEPSAHGTLKDFLPERRNWRRDPRDEIPFGSGHLARFLLPAPARRTHESMEILTFPISNERERTEGTLLDVVSRLPSVPAEDTQMLADAVAVAGASAASLGRRRAVVLVAGREAEDQSEIDVCVAVRYLARIGVPFRIWSTTTRFLSGDWGDVEDVSTFDRLFGAMKRLTRDLDRQRIVWIPGFRPLSSIRLSEKAKGLSIVGR